MQSLNQVSRKVTLCVKYIIHFFNLIPDNHCQQVVRMLGKSHAQSLIHKTRLSARYCGNFEFIRVFVGSVVNIINIKEGISFFLVHGEWIVARNKQIAREPLRGSRNSFVLPHESRKKYTHSWNISKFAFVLNLRKLRNWLCDLQNSLVIIT